MLAGDGTCVIDVVRRAKNVYSRDYATIGQIREAATKIIRGCLDGFAVNDRGGFMGHVGRLRLDLPEHPPSTWMDEATRADLG